MKTLLLFFSLVCLGLVSQVLAFETDPHRLIFKSLTTDHGLSQGSINAIAQDNQGFMWFGTNDGLNRYDGYRFDVFRYQAGDPHSITSNQINDLFVDSSGVLWVGTARGLNSFDPQSGTFYLWEDGPLTVHTHVTSLCMDRNGIIWLGSQNSGLMVLDPASGKVNGYVHDPDDNSSLASNETLKVFADTDNRIWVSTSNGSLQQLNRRTGAFLNAGCQLGMYAISDHYAVFDIDQDTNGMLWLAVFGAGLIKMDPNTSVCVRYDAATYSDHAGTSVVALINLTIEEDHILWMSTRGHGLIRYDMSSDERTNYIVGSEKQHLAYHTLSNVYVDRDGNLWIGTNGHGINLANKYGLPVLTIGPSIDANIFVDLLSMRAVLEVSPDVYWISGYYGIRELDLASLKVTSFQIPYQRAVFRMLRDLHDHDLIWIGTEGTGMILYNRREDVYTKIPFIVFAQPDIDEYQGVVGGAVYSLLQLPGGLLLAGTERGLNVLDPETMTSRFYRHDPEDQSSIPPGFVIALYLDSSNDIWVGTSMGGMAYFDLASGSFQAHHHRAEELAGKAFRINCFYEDSAGDFWVGTNMGLHLHDRDGGTCRVYTKADGLPNEFIYGILEDSAGRLWLSTNNGLSCFDPVESSFINYDKRDGLLGNEFNTASYFQSGTKRLFFGGVDGLVALEPDRIIMRQWSSEPVITRVTRHGEFGETIARTHNQQRVVWDKQVKIMTIEFSSLDYVNPGKSKYAYRIDYLGDHLLSMSDQRQLTLTRPRPGTYQIDVFASDQFGEWTSMPASFSLVVQPRFFETRMFRLIMIVLVILTMMMVFHIRTAAINRQKKKLALLVDEKTSALKQSNEALKQLNTTKDKFFSIIAHDLKSPFNALLGFAGLLKDQWKHLDEAQRQSYVETIHTTTDNTYQLLLQLLDWSRVQNNSIDLVSERFRLVEVVKDVAVQLSGQAGIKSIRVTIDIPDHIEVFTDKQMVTTIFRNLVSNAIKFSLPGYQVRIDATPTHDFVICRVSDEGTGMVPDAIELIFDMNAFFTTPGTGKEKGTGLGLPVCYEFVKKMGGHIWVESKAGQGSCFSFSIPVREI